MPAKKKEKKEFIEVKDYEAKTCGLVMPISALDGCSEQHWMDVKEILEEVVRQAGFEPNLVSNADDVGIIQKRIVSNLYTNTIVICDVSGKNPNVMFELGMRLAFDKPTIIVKDDKTNYSFDTAPIEHLEYPRDLRFTKIVKFKETLKDKINGTIRMSDNDPNFSIFLKHFGEFKVPKIDSTEVSKEDFIFDQIRDDIAGLRQLVLQTNRNTRTDRPLIPAAISDVLATLTPKEQRIIRLNFGLEDSKQRSVEEISREFKISDNEVKNIINTAISKLRHPRIVRALRNVSLEAYEHTAAEHLLQAIFIPNRTAADTNMFTNVINDRGGE